MFNYFSKSKNHVKCCICEKPDSTGLDSAPCKWESILHIKRIFYFHRKEIVLVLQREVYETWIALVKTIHCYNTYFLACFSFLMLWILNIERSFRKLMMKLWLRGTGNERVRKEKKCVRAFKMARVVWGLSKKCNRQYWKLLGQFPVLLSKNYKLREPT